MSSTTRCSRALRLPIASRRLTRSCCRDGRAWRRRPERRATHRDRDPGAKQRVACHTCRVRDEGLRRLAQCRFGRTAPATSHLRWSTGQAVRELKCVAWVGWGPLHYRTGSKMRVHALYRLPGVSLSPWVRSVRGRACRSRSSSASRKASSRTRGHLSEQDDDLRDRFRSALRCLDMAAHRGTIEGDGGAEREARGFLGWTPRGHWLVTALAMTAGASATGSPQDRLDLAPGTCSDSKAEVPRTEISRRSPGRRGA